MSTCNSQAVFIIVNYIVLRQLINCHILYYCHEIIAVCIVWFFVDVCDVHCMNLLLATDSEADWRNSRSSYPKCMGHCHPREHPWSYRERHSLIRSFFQDPILENRRTVKCKWSKKLWKADHVDLSSEACKLSRVVENLAVTEKELRYSTFNVSDQNFEVPKVIGSSWYNLIREKDDTQSI